MNLLSLFNVDPAILAALVASVGIPFLTALLAKAHWNSAATGLITLALASGNGFLAQWASNGDFHWKQATGTAVVSYVVAVAAHYGILKGTTTEAQLLAVGSAHP